MFLIKGTSQKRRMFLIKRNIPKEKDVPLIKYAHIFFFILFHCDLCKYLNILKNKKLKAKYILYNILFT